MDPVGLVALLGLALRLILRGRLIAALRSLKRSILVGLGIRRISPRLGELLPAELVIVAPAGDTGGGYRPKHRAQDPAKDPREPHGSESSSKGTDHGWSNCTMSSGADALAYQTGGRLELWGGDLRHAQGDLDGGTDLYDLRDAWAEYGETLKIKSGAGWEELRDDHGDRRAIVIQGIGNCPGSGTFTGGHACVIGIETNSSGDWLWGDPCVSDWQWVPPSKIRSWAEAWQSSIAYAVSSPVPEPEPPDPEPPAPEPPKPVDPWELVGETLALVVPRAEADAVTAAGDELVGVWLEWLRAPRPTPADRWDVGAWVDEELELEELVDGDVDPCIPGAPALWSRGRLPFPVADALDALLRPALWEASAWRGAAWPAVSDRAAGIPHMPPDAA